MFKATKSSTRRRPTVPGSIRDLTVTNRPIESLKPNPRNPRTHSKKQIQAVANIIREVGWTVPIITAPDGLIVAGHARYEAAKLLHFKEVPTVCIRDLSKTQIRAYVIADNRLAELAGWDRSILAAELADLASVEFDVALTGFNPGAVDLLLEEVSDDDRADEVPEVDQGASVSQLGDLWRLGKHRLLCGDARSPVEFKALMAGAAARVVFVDVPYNVRIAGNVSGLGRVRHGEFAMASGEMTDGQYVAFLQACFRNLADHTTDGSIHFVCIDWRHLGDVLAAGRAVYSEFKNLCVWVKSNAGMGTFYRSRHELVVVYKSGRASHLNNFELGQNGRNRTNVWEYAGVNTFKNGRLDELRLHPTTKPVAMVADAIKDVSKRGDIVLDAFMGSGTTIIAAERTGRVAYGIEIGQRYVDVAIRRWQGFSGKDAIHAATGATFDELAERREAPGPGRSSAKLRRDDPSSVTLPRRRRVAPRRHSADSSDREGGQ